MGILALEVENVVGSKMFIFLLTIFGCSRYESIESFENIQLGKNYFLYKNFIRNIRLKVIFRKFMIINLCTANKLTTEYGIDYRKKF